MRDRDPLAPELLTAGESGAGAFAEVALRRDGETQRFRFGISEPALAVLRSILATRPFDAMPGVRHRYFYAGQGGRGGEQATHLLYVRVEQGRDVRTLAFEAPRELVGVLHWFRQLPTLAAAAHLVAPT
jgi:hypothetical protein